MYRIALNGRMFEVASAWEQMEAAQVFGYWGVAFTPAQCDTPTDDALRARGLARYCPPVDACDPASLFLANTPPTQTALCAFLQDASCVRVRDFGYAQSSMVSRRIGHGIVDWQGILSALRETGFDGVLLIDADTLGNPAMETQRALAAASMRDLRALLLPSQPMQNWHAVSPDVPGLHEVISPRRSDCSVLTMYRLNLLEGQQYTLASGTLEMNAALIAGACRAHCDAFEASLQKLDAFYVPGGFSVTLTATTDCTFFIAGAACEQIGKPFVRKFDQSQPLGSIHQIHGAGSGQREVFFTLNPEVPASRLLCGVTWGNDGAWTSWPAHQHERDLEEVYCYFDIDSPGLGLHGSYERSGDMYTDPVMHPVRGGHFLLAPRGYHPTVAAPGTRNAYFWALAAFSHESRRYDLAVNDPKLG